MVTSTGIVMIISYSVHARLSNSAIRTKHVSYTRAAGNVLCVRQLSDEDINSNGDHSCDDVHVTIKISRNQQKKKM